MIRYFFHIAYKGTKYRDWQRQKTVLSIQEIIEDRLQQIFKLKISCLGCGRTDAEVHAAQYFFHIDVKNEIPENFKFVLNRSLPNDILIHDVIKMDGEQHAQFDAIERTYDYFIHITKNPFLSDISSYYLLEDLDFVLMKIAASLLLKYTDFRAFCKTPDRHNSTICNIKSVNLYKTEEGDKIRFQITANKFLKSMIRIIVNKLIDIGLGRLSIEEFEYYLKSKETPKYNKLAHPQGLYLSKITYPFLKLKQRTDTFPILHSEINNYWIKID